MRSSNRGRRKKNIKFDLTIDKSLPDAVSGDEGALRRIVFNLLDNALKFTDKGCVSVKIFGTNEDDDFALAIDIEDTGIGIASDQIETIFDKFAQAESSTTRRFDGAGAGLAISRLLTPRDGRRYHRSFC